MHRLQVRCERIPHAAVRIPQIRHSNASPLSGQRISIDKVTANGSLTESEEPSETHRLHKVSGAFGPPAAFTYPCEEAAPGTNKVWNVPNRAQPRGRGGFEL